MKKLSFFLMAMLFSVMSFAVEVTVTIGDYAAANGWENSVQQTSLTMDEVVTVTANPTTGTYNNTGKYYTSGTNWRMYQNEAPAIVVTAAEGYLLTSVTFTYESNKTGVMVDAAGAQVASGTVVALDNVASATFSVSNTNPDVSNGQARITAITVVYEAAVVEPVKLYLNAKDWGYGDARFAAYFFDPAKWVDMTKVEGEAYIYEVEVPAGYTQVIFVRMNGNTTENNWDNKWNQTGNLTIPTDGKNMFKPDGWDGKTTTWSTYTPSVKYTFTKGSTWYIDFSAITGKKGANYPKADAADIDYSATAGGTVIPVTFTADVTWAEGATFIKTEEGGWDALTFTTPTEGANCAQVAADGKSYTWTTYAPVVTYDVTVADATVTTEQWSIDLAGTWEERTVTVKLWQDNVQGFGEYAANAETGYTCQLTNPYAELTPTTAGLYADNGDGTFTFTATMTDAEGGIYNISVTGAIPADEPEINWIEMPLEITNLTTDILTVGEATYLQLMGRNDMEDSDVMLFLNNYTGEEKAYEVNAESSVMTFGGMEFTVMDGSITKSVDPELGDVYAGTVHASMDEDGQTMYVEFALTMYALPPVELEIIDAVASVDEATGRLVLTAEWTDTVSMVTYPVSITVAGYNEADLEETGFVEYEAAQVSEIQIGDDDNWFDFAVANAVAIFKEGNAVTIEAEYTSGKTGATYYVYAEGEMQGGEDPDYMLLEDNITNLVIDLENMAIMGGPSTMWQVEVFLGLAEDDNMDGQWSLSPESSVAIMGLDARFIDGYVYDIDVNAPAAKAVLYVEDSGFFYEIKLDMTSTPTEAIVVVVEDATVQIDTIPMFGDVVDYALKMTANWTYAEDGVTYPVLVEVPVYYPEATEPSEMTCTVTIGDKDDYDPWLGFGEGTLTITTVDGVVTAKGIASYPYTGVAFDVTVSGKLPQGPGTGIDNVQVEVKTVKMIKNGQLIINKGGREFNAQGATLK